MSRSENIKAGISRARANGRRLGRPPIPEWIREEVLSFEGVLSVRKIARKFNISKSATHRIIKNES